MPKIQLRYTYDLNEHGCLILYADAEDQQAIRELVEEHGCDYCGQCEVEALEYLISDSELEWIAPEQIGALTDAPILGMWGKETDVKPTDVPFRVVGRWGEPLREWYQPLIQAWGFMDYQLRSFLHDLAETGKATFIS